METPGKAMQDRVTMFHMLNHLWSNTQTWLKRMHPTRSVKVMTIVISNYGNDGPSNNVATMTITITF